MFARAGHDLLRVALRLAVQLWPLWLFWFVWSLFDDLVARLSSDLPRPLHARVTPWPTTSGRPSPCSARSCSWLAAIVAYRLDLATRFMPIAGIAGVVIATVADRLAGVSAPRAIYRSRAARWIFCAPSISAFCRLSRSAVSPPLLGWAPDVSADSCAADRPAPGPWPVRQFRPRRLARHARRAPPVPRPGRDPSAASSSARPTGSTRTASRAAPSTRRTKAPGARAAPRRC